MVIEDLKLHAKNIRKNILRQVYGAQSGHPGGSLGATDILTVLYFDVMDINKENAGGIDRDRFVLSKGHVSPLLYAVLAEKGILAEEELKTFRLIDSKLQGHPNMNYVTGVDMSTGSLGQGFAVADGMALANKLAGNDHRIYCLIVDVNGLQIDGKTSDVIGPEPLDQKFAAFGFHVICVDGHNMEELKAAFAEAKTVKGKPTAIIARTVKGKGVSFMENNAGWHGKAPNQEQFEAAMAELEAE